MEAKRNSVKVVEYDSSWGREFDKEKEILSGIFKTDAIAIEHIGSTSVKGLSAKPIIDIAVALNKLEDFEIVRYYFDSNEEYSVRLENTVDEILIRKGPDEEITHLIHVMEYSSSRYQNTIIFRDYLRNHENVKNEYERLKKELAIKYKDNRKMYTASKNGFIQKILKMAKNNS